MPSSTWSGRLCVPEWEWSVTKLERLRAIPDIVSTKWTELCWSSGRQATTWGPNLACNLLLYSSKRRIAFTFLNDRRKDKRRLIVFCEVKVMWNSNSMVRFNEELKLPIHLKNIQGCFHVQWHTEWLQQTQYGPYGLKYWLSSSLPKIFYHCLKV